MDKETLRRREIINIWMDAWNNKILGIDYGEARKFRDYWIEKYPGLSLEKALIKYKNHEQ